MSELHQYGIMQEDSDHRAHVCPVAGKVYVFDTPEACRVIRDGEYPLRPAYQKGVNGKTATGWLVPPADLEAAEIHIRECTWNYFSFSDAERAPTKGRKATRLVVAMLRKGLFPLPACPDGDVGVEADLDGKDIVATIEQHTRTIQVKCDYRGGREGLGGTGNLYLQKAERNPRNLHDGEQAILKDP